MTPRVGYPALLEAWPRLGLFSPAKPGLGLLLAAQSHIPQGWGGWVIFWIGPHGGGHSKTGQLFRQAQPYAPGTFGKRRNRFSSPGANQNRYLNHFPLDAYLLIATLLWTSFSRTVPTLQKWVRRFVGVNDPEGRLPCLAGGLTSARVIFPG